MFSPSSFSQDELVDLLLITGFVLIFKYLYERLVNDVNYYKVGAADQ